MAEVKLIAGGVAAILLLYLLHVNRAMSGCPEEARKFTQKRWSEEQVREEYARVKRSPTDIRKFLPPKLGRRYVVVGGSGMVGRWVVQHLLLRGEDPAAIRILDIIEAPTRFDLAADGVDFVKTDVTDDASVQSAFERPWPPHVAALPLTVFHHVAIIDASARAVDFLGPYMRVNVHGTRHVIAAAKRAGADCLVATSSGSVGMKTPKFFLTPWRWWPRGWFQLNSNGDNKGRKAGSNELPGCYVISKILAEVEVMEANSKENNFHTGVIRPGHGIYCHGVENTSSLTWAYLQRGGAPTWLGPIVTNFVSAENVSIAHLQYENRLVAPASAGKPDISGRAYAVCDPDGPILYDDLYMTLTTLAHPSAKPKFTRVPPVPLLLLAYLIEAYMLIRHRYAEFLPKVTGNLAGLTPGLFQVCTVHLVYDDTKSKDELGFKAPITTMEGLCLAVDYWNEKFEARAKQGGDIKADAK